MEFLKALSQVYDLYRNGRLNQILAAVGDLEKKSGDIRSQLSKLENNIAETGVRLGQAEDKVVRKSLDIQTDADFGAQHAAFETTYRVIAAGCSPFLVGPAGSGKSTILAQVATALELPFYPMSVNSLTSDYNIIGYKDANGNYVSTIFRQAYENGGLFSFEEIDAGNPNVLTVINNAMSQDKYSFPDKIVDKHPRFIMAASGNTYGTGASMQYIGRNPLDAATLDRFVMVHADYDTVLENRLCMNKEWLEWIHRVRAFVTRYNMHLVVGTRAVINGEKLLNIGIPRKVVEEMVVFKGLSLADVEKIRQNTR